MPYPPSSSEQAYAMSNDPIVSQKIIDRLRFENAALAQKVIDLEHHARGLEHTNAELHARLDRVLPVLAATRRSIRAAKLDAARRIDVDLSDRSSVIDLDDAASAPYERPSVARRRLVTRSVSER